MHQRPRSASLVRFLAPYGVVQHLNDYAWPGNIRELEQCVRNVLIRKEYQPAAIPPASRREQIARDIYDGQLSADELLSRYCTLVFAQIGNYQETARRLRLDRRTVKNKIDKQLLAELRQRV